MPNAFKERLHKGYAQSMELAGSPLVDEKSAFQRIKIFDTIANGRVLTLDDIVQITTRDESAYAEMLTHLPMLEHGQSNDAVRASAMPASAKAPFMTASRLRRELEDFANAEFTAKNGRAEEVS